MLHNAIEIKDLKKIYNIGKKNEKIALNSINLKIPMGSFFGLLGFNGAGKSTLINIIANLVNKTSGSVSICGFDIEKKIREAKSSIGLVPQEINFDPFFPPIKSLEQQAGLFGIFKSERRSMEILKAVGLEDKAFVYSRNLSGGMKRRLLIAKALVHNPPVLILDEPTAGVDVKIRKQIWKYISKLNKLGTTIILSTHYLEEAQELCDQIAILDNGNVIVNEFTQKLLENINSKKLIIIPNEKLLYPPKLNKKIKTNLDKNGNIIINYEPKKIGIMDILVKVQNCKIGIKDIIVQKTSLEDIFLKFTKNL